MLFDLESLAILSKNVTIGVIELFRFNFEGLSKGVVAVSCVFDLKVKESLVLRGV